MSGSKRWFVLRNKETGRYVADLGGWQADKPQHAINHETRDLDKAAAFKVELRLAGDPQNQYLCEIIAATEAEFPSWAWMYYELAEVEMHLK